MERFVGVLGIILLLAGAWLFSTNRKAIRWRAVAIGVALQVLFAVFVTRVGWGERGIAAAGRGAKSLLDCSFAGSSFVFGEAGKPAAISKLGFIFAFQVLPAIIFISAFFAILYYFGIMQFLIRMVAAVMERALGASGAESLNIAASIVMGQTEAPLTIRPYLARLTQSEMMVVMTAGMAHVSGPGGNVLPFKPCVIHNRMVGDKRRHHLNQGIHREASRVRRRLRKFRSASDND